MSIDRLRFNLDNELSFIKNKTPCDSKYFAVGRRGKLILTNKPKTCFERFINFIGSIFNFRFKRLVNKFVILTNQIEEYLKKEKNEEKLTTFIQNYSLSINEIYRCAAKIHKIHPSFLRSNKTQTETFILAPYIASRKIYRFYSPFKFKNESKQNVTYELIPLGNKTNSWNDSIKEDDFDDGICFSNILSSFEPYRVIAKIEIYSTIHLDPNFEYFFTIFPDRIDTQKKPTTLKVNPQLSFPKIRLSWKNEAGCEVKVLIEKLKNSSIILQPKQFMSEEIDGAYLNVSSITKPTESYISVTLTKRKIIPSFCKSIELEFFVDPKENLQIKYIPKKIVEHSLGTVIVSTDLTKNTEQLFIEFNGKTNSLKLLNLDLKKETPFEISFKNSSKNTIAVVFTITNGKKSIELEPFFVPAEDDVTDYHYLNFIEEIFLDLEKRQILISWLGLDHHISVKIREYQPIN